MKRVIAVLLIAALCLTLFTVIAGAVPAPYIDDDGTLHQYTYTLSEPYNNDLVFNNNKNYSSPTIFYQPDGADGSDEWQSATMTYYDMNEFGDDMYFYNFPADGNYIFYITDGTHRTSYAEYRNDNLIVYFNDYTDENGYDGLDYDMMAGGDQPQAPTEPNLPDGTDNRCYERLTAYLRTLPSFFGDIYSYEELYYHQDAAGDTDWVLIHADCGEPEWSVRFGFVGNRAFLMGPLSPFTFGMTLYDVAEDTFLDLYGMTDYSRYEGLLDAIDTYGKGRLLGDMDNDNQLSIIDATILQRCLAYMLDYPEDDLITMEGQPLAYWQAQNDGYKYYEDFDLLTYYSDFDRNGERDVTDVTAIQRYLVGLQ